MAPTAAWSQPFVCEGCGAFGPNVTRSKPREDGKVEVACGTCGNRWLEPKGRPGVAQVR